MPTHELHHNVKFSKAISAINYTGAGTDDGDIIDRQGFGSLEFQCIVGVDANLDGSNHLQFKLQHGDDAALADAADVVIGDLIGDLIGGLTEVTTGIFAIVDAPAEDDTVFSIGYKGNKRYVRLSIIVTGATTDCPAGAIAAQGHPDNAPVV